MPDQATICKYYARSTRRDTGHNGLMPGVTIATLRRVVASTSLSTSLTSRSCRGLCGSRSHISHNSTTNIAWRWAVGGHKLYALPRLSTRQVAAGVTPGIRALMPGVTLQGRQGSPSGSLGTQNPKLWL
jgi:hypothetical protein